MKHICLTVLAAALLSGCEWFERDLEWKQEVRLQDGRTVMVDRVSKVTGKRFPEGGNYDIYQSLAFTHPDTNERIAWAPPEHSGPVMLDVDGPQAYVVVEAISVGDYNTLGCPNPPYFVYRYAGGRWMQIPINDMPARFLERNIQRRSMENKDAIADNLVTLEEYKARMYDWRVRKENRIISRERMSPIGHGCREGVLMNQGRHSEIDTRR